MGDAFGATAETPERIQAKVEAHEKAAAEAEVDWARFKEDKTYRHIVQIREAQKLEEERQRESYQQRERDGRER